MDMGSVQWTYGSGAFQTAAPIIPTGDVSDLSPLISPIYATKNYGYNSSYDTSDFVIWGHASSGTIRVRDSRYTSASVYKEAMSGVQLVRKLITPTTVQLTAEEVETLFGANNVWCSSGNIIKLTYRRAWEIALAQGE